MCILDRVQGDTKSEAKFDAWEKLGQTTKKQGKAAKSYNPTKLKVLFSFGRYDWS